MCDTNSHFGSGTFLVEVNVPGKGNAAIATNGNGTFQYVDYWSSIWTWGGLGIPQEGEFIVIEEGQEIVLDVSTPKLAFLLLREGSLKQNMFGCGANIICKVALKSYHGKYVVAELDGNANANSHEIGEMETWIVTFIDDDKVTFKSTDQKYLVADPNGNAYANSLEAGDWETFTVAQSDLGNGIFTFRSHHGKWLSADKHGALDANRDHALGWETFEVILLSESMFDICTL